MSILFAELYQDQIREGYKRRPTMNSMKLRQEFHKVLEQTVIPSNLFQNQKVKLYETWGPYSYDAVPKKLYRYRNYSTLSIEAFYYDQMWFSAASKMNDGFDTRLCYDKNEFVNAIDSEFSNDSLIKFVDDVLSSESPLKFFLQKYISKEDLQDQSVFFNKPIVRTLVSIRDSIMNNKNNTIDYLMTSMQSLTKIACLSENISSPEMWGHYASSEEGFALQYDCSEIYSKEENPNDADPKLCSIYPVIYQSNRYNIPVSYLRYLFKQRIFGDMYNQIMQANPNAVLFANQLMPFLSIINPCPDESMFTKVALYKSNEWKVEKEWRILCSCADPVFTQTDYAPIIKKPTAIFLGRRMKPNSRNMIIDIAKEKKLPIYQMRINDASPKYLLKPERIK